MVVTSRVLDELIDAGVTADAIVGSARDPAERIDVGALPASPALIVRTEGVDGGSYVTRDGTQGGTPLRRRHRAIGAPTPTAPAIRSRPG